MKQHTKLLQQLSTQFNVQVITSKIAKKAIKGGAKHSIVTDDVIDGS
ncbi:MAG: hypothetical protein AAFP19_25525 [Bacteroidota bacterium]